MTLPTTPMNNGTGTRPLGRCLTYLRRSLDRQEHGIHSHFEWAQAKAAELGLVMRATKADLEAMLASGDPVRNDLYLDSGITGANLGRPGLLALRRDAIADSGVSHVLVHNLDRLARPEITAEAMTQDNGLLYAGITIVTASTIRLPRVRGVVYLVDDILALCAYTESGEFLNRLGERVVPAMRQVAEQGFRVGGTTPYGFGRVLIDATTGEKVMDLPKHMRVRQPGCRVSLEVADPEKIRIWLYMLDLYHRERLGFRRIARKLNDLGYPSPGAADTRRVRSNGSVGMASGRWTAETVRRLINNRVIAGITSWGQTSVGAHRRLGPSGAPRLLESADRDKLNRPKPVRNPQEVVVTAAVRGLQPPADPAILDKCRQIAKARREGRPSPTRSRDMGRYPLSGCVIDGCCGSTMWGQSKGRDGIRYLCSRYHKSVAASATTTRWMPRHSLRSRSAR